MAAASRFYVVLRNMDMDRIKLSLLLSFILLLAGCKSVEYVPVTRTVTDSVYVDRWTRDSIYLHDSVWVNRWTDGDTVYVDKVVTRYAYKDRWLRDTVAMTRRDTTTVTRQVEVEKELSWWQETQMGGFWVLAAGILLWVAVKNRGKLAGIIKKTT